MTADRFGLDHWRSIARATALFRLTFYGARQTGQNRETGGTHGTIMTACCSLSALPTTAEGSRVT
jgi:hypothetical protein